MRCQPSAERESLPSDPLTIALTKLCRYKPDVSSKFITQELGFAVDEDESVFEADQLRSCLDFITRHGGQHLLQDKDGDVRVATGKAGNLFEGAKQASNRVDIKGQI